MKDTVYEVVISSEVVGDNPPVAAELSDADGNRIQFKDKLAALEWCDRMSRLGKKELELVSLAGETVADGKIIDKNGSVAGSLDRDEGEEGGFDEFYEDAFRS